MEGGEWVREATWAVGAGGRGEQSMTKSRPSQEAQLVSSCVCSFLPSSAACLLGQDLIPQRGHLLTPARRDHHLQAHDALQLVPNFHTHGLLIPLLKKTTERAETFTPSHCLILQRGCSQWSTAS